MTAGRFRGYDVFFETMLTTARIADMEQRGAWAGDLFGESVAGLAEEREQQPAIIDRFGTLTWGEVLTIADHVAKGLLELGVRRGDVVQVQLPNWRQFVLAVLGVEHIGAVVNPVAPIFRSNEVTVMSRLARPKVVITAQEYRGFELAAMHAELRAECQWVEELVVVGESSPVGALTWEELLEQGRFSSYDRAAVDLVRPDPNDVCEIMFTSGTTGQPKGVMHTQNTLNNAARAFLETVCDGVAGGAGPIVFHMASTLAHQTGYLYGIRAPLLTGGTVVLQDAWDAGEFVELIETHSVNVSMGATPFLADVLAIDGVEERRIDSFQRFVCAGAPIPVPVLEQADRRLPCVVLPGWGMTECGLVTVGKPTDEFGLRVTDGSPVDHNAVRVVDADGRPIVDAEGDLQYRGSLAFVGYAQGRELSESCWTDGWFDTGDRAVMFENGYIRIAGRTKDLVIRGGENIPVKEIEDVLLRMDNIANVAIVAQPDERLGEIACAFVLAEGAAPTLDDLRHHLAAEDVTKQFWPEALRIVTEFPMTPSGKVQKFRLREQL